TITWKPPNTRTPTGWRAACWHSVSWCCCCCTAPATGACCVSDRGIQAHFQLRHPGFTLDCALALPGQGFTVLFGRSGCGKTTLLRCIAGLQKASGELRWGNTSWQNSQHFVPTHKRPLAYVFQEPRLFPHLNVRGNLHFGLDRVPAEERRIGFDEAVDWLGLAQLLDHTSA